MSQRRQNKSQISVNNVDDLSDHELREALKGYNQAPGPITDSTRNLYRKKLLSLIDEKPSKLETTGNAIIDQYYDDDTSDEDYNANEEDDYDDEEDDEEEELDEEGSLVELVDELMDDDIKLSSTTSGNRSTSLIGGTESSANFISRGILISLISFFIAIFSFYLISQNKYTLAVPAFPRNFTRQLFTLSLISSIVYAIYKVISFYRLRRHQENERVCLLVGEVLELLQSPDNPKGMMPILHIRDTLLTPAERKSKKMISLWTKAEKFIEDHESRIKVEIVDIDGDEFRAWKWIGAKTV